MSEKAFALGGAIPDDEDQDDTQDNQQVAGNIPPRPAGPGGDSPDQNPFPIKTPAPPFGKRLGAIPEGAADDTQTASLDNALQTVDSIMQYGYQQHGINTDQQQSTAMADGGDVPVLPIGGTLPPVQDEHAIDMNRLTAQAAKAAIQSTTKKSSGSRSYADGGTVDNQDGAIPDNDAQPGIGTAIQTLAPPAPGGQQGIAKLVGLVQGVGAMPPQQAQQLEKQTGENDPNTAKIKTAAKLAQDSGPQAAWSYMQSLRKQFDTARTAAAVKASMGALPQSTQAANIAMTNVLDGTDTRFTPAPDGKSVYMTVNKLKESGGKGYADGGTVDANGNDDNETLTADANMEPQAAPQVNQPFGSLTAIPEGTARDVNSPGNPAAGSGNYPGASLLKIKLSIPQYFQLLMGKGGQYDPLYNNGPVGAAKAVAQGPGMPPPPPPAGQDAANATTYAQSISGAINTASPEEMGGTAVGRVGKAMSGAVSGAVHTLANPGAGMSTDTINPYANMGPQTPQPPAPAGTTQETPPVQSQGGAPAAAAATPPPQWPTGQQPAKPQQPGQTSTGTPESDHEAMERIYGKDAVKAAELSHPWVSQGADRMAQLNTEREKALGYQAQQKNTSILSEGRQGTARIRAGAYVDAATIRAAATNQASSNRLFGTLEGIAAGMHNNAVTNTIRGLDAKTAAGQPLSDTEVAWMQKLLSGTAPGQQTPQQPQGSGARPQAVKPVDYTQTPGVSQVQQGQQRTVLINNKPYFVDPGGKVLGPAQ